MIKTIFSIIIVAVISLYSGLKFGAAYANEPESGQEPAESGEAAPEEPEFEGTMTLKRIDNIVTRIDENVEQPRPGFWNFNLNNIRVQIITDEKNDRMRIVSGIKKADDLSKDDLLRIAQANYDSALDARYAVANGVLWAVYIHPLRALYDKQFISALAQTITTASEYGKSYSSGAFVFNGGDSQGIIQQKIINQLKDKGLAI